MGTTGVPSSQPPKAQGQPGVPALKALGAHWERSGQVGATVLNARIPGWAAAFRVLASLEQTEILSVVLFPS